MAARSISLMQPSPATRSWYLPAPYIPAWAAGYTSDLLTLLKLTPTVTASNTLLAKNTHSYQPQPPVPDDCFGVLTSLGFNLIEQISNCNVTNTLGNITGQDPLLGPLQNNGGLTLTQELLAGSPAIDAGNNAVCPATDQRGVGRPYQRDMRHRRL